MYAINCSYQLHESFWVRGYLKDMYVIEFKRYAFIDGGKQFRMLRVNLNLHITNQA